MIATDNKVFWIELNISWFNPLLEASFYWVSWGNLWTGETSRKGRADIMPASCPVLSVLIVSWNARGCRHRGSHWCTSSSLLLSLLSSPPSSPSSKTVTPCSRRLSCCCSTQDIVNKILTFTLLNTRHCEQDSNITFSLLSTRHCEQNINISGAQHKTFWTTQRHFEQDTNIFPVLSMLNTSHCEQYTNISGAQPKTF